MIIFRGFIDLGNSITPPLPASPYVHPARVFEALKLLLHLEPAFEALEVVTKFNLMVEIRAAVAGRVI